MKKEKALERLIKIPMYMFAIRFIGIEPGITSSEITKKLDGTYAHISKLKNLLIEVEWVRGHKTGRYFKLYPTLKGLEIAKAVDKFFYAMGIIDKLEVKDDGSDKENI